MAANTRVRIEGTQNLVEAALKNGVKHMQSQSIAFTYEGGNLQRIRLLITMPQAIVKSQLTVLKV